MRRFVYNISRVMSPSAAELAALERVMQERALAKHEQYVREGEVCRSLAFH